MLISESAKTARKDGGSALNQQRKEILVPFTQIKNKISSQPQEQKSVQAVPNDNSKRDTSSKSMAFALVTKKGNKTNVKQIDVPIDNFLAIKTKERIDQEELERAQVKDQILKMAAHEHEKSPLKSDGNDLDND